jgi:predicted nucleic acid-binding Zn ribbon protein
MPRYLYQCQSCDKYFEKTHSIKEKYVVCSEVTSCEEASKLTRIPSFSSVLKKSSTTLQKVAIGQVVNDNIKQAREELKQQQRTAKKEASKETK